MSPATKRLVVELFDSARDIAAAAEIELDLEIAATARDALRALAASCPALSGPVIDPTCWLPRPYYLLNLDGIERIRNHDLPLPPGSRVILMAALVGGL